MSLPGTVKVSEDWDLADDDLLEGSGGQGEQRSPNTFLTVNGEGVVDSAAGKTDILTVQGAPVRNTDESPFATEAGVGIDVGPTGSTNNKEGTVNELWPLSNPSLTRQIQELWNA